MGKPIHCFIHWIEIHRVDGAIQLLNNWDLLLHLFKRDDDCLVPMALRSFTFCFMRRITLFSSNSVCLVPSKHLLMQLFFFTANYINCAHHHQIKSVTTLCLNWIKVSATLKIAIFPYLRFQRFQIDILESFLQKKIRGKYYLCRKISGVKDFFSLTILTRSVIPMSYTN